MFNDLCHKIFLLMADVDTYLNTIHANMGEYPEKHPAFENHQKACAQGRRMIETLQKIEVLGDDDMHVRSDGAAARQAAYNSANPYKRGSARWDLWREGYSSTQRWDELVKSYRNKHDDV